MKINRNLRQPLLLVATVAAALALGACNKSNDANAPMDTPPATSAMPPATTPPPPTPDYMPPPASTSTTPMNPATTGTTSQPR